MLQEVFELLMKVHEGMHIVSIGLLDGTTIQRKHDTKGSSDTVVELKMEKMDVGYVTFSKHTCNSYINNQGQVTSQTDFNSILAIPYSNISYVEFSYDEE